MTKKNSTKRMQAPRKRTAVLHQDACPPCGTLMQEASGTFSMPVHGDEVEVSGIPHLRCPACKEVVFRLADSQRLEQAVLEGYRRRHDLLSPSMIRTLREHLKLSNEEFAHLLGMDPKTVQRWEEGRRVQTPAQDRLLRLLRDLPGSYEYLRQRAA